MARSRTTVRQKSDLEFAADYLQHKYDKLVNPNTPNARKLRMAIGTIRDLDNREKTRMKNSWAIQYYDANGQRLLASEVDDGVRNYVADLVRRGFGTGIF